MKRKFSHEFDITILPKVIFDIIGSFFIRSMKDLYRLLNVSKNFQSLTLENWMKFVGVYYSPQYKIWASKHSKYIVKIADGMIDFNMDYPNVQSLRLEGCGCGIYNEQIKKVCPNMHDLVIRHYICEQREQFLPIDNIKMLSTYNWFPELFDRCTQLTHLDLSKSQQLTTLDGIEVLVNLIYLDIGQTRVEKIDPLQSLQNLKCLNILKTRVTQISNLKNCIGLEFLCVDEKHITDWKECNNEVKIIQPKDWKRTIQNLGIIPITSFFPLYELYL